MKSVVYFNQWFSSIAWVMEDLKKRNDIKIIASSRNKNHAYANYADEFIVEDWEETEDKEQSMNNYINWVLNLCKKYKVDYFFVKKHSNYISERLKDFSEAGVKLIVENHDVLKSIESKSEVYRKLETYNEIKDYIPMYINSYNGMEIIKLLLEHKDRNDMCLKFDCDEGGASFRAIDDTPVTINSLYGFRVNKITTSEAIRLIVSADRPERLIVMERLDSPEISVDCYNSKQGFVSICREKGTDRTQHIYYNKEISELCCKIGDILGLKFPYNVQFRYEAGSEAGNNKKQLKLLEVNPRISGGLYYEVTNGLNIADICLKDCMNRESEYNVKEFIDFDDMYVTHLEMPIKNE